VATDRGPKEVRLNFRLPVEQHNSTRLTNRDRDIFIAMLDDSEAEPNKALAAAARQYKGTQR
jgi:uncharacterized protein (DUF1778 family)